MTESGGADAHDRKPDLALINGLIFDGRSADLVEGHVLISGDRIVAVTTDPPPAAVRTIDLGGRFLMPGMIDAHIHAYLADVNIYKSDRMPLTLVAQRAHVILSRMLARGFTTVRDVGGADYGLAQAIRDGWVAAPQLIYCGKAISQTGGHGDMRSPADDLCFCGHADHGRGYVGHISQTADGIDAVRMAVRENFRQGATFIKIMGSGGASSVADPLRRAQYAEDEIRAIVDEAERHGAYVTAHCHPDLAIRRCAELGVHCIEHGTMVEADTAALLAAKDVGVVPTLTTIHLLGREGARLGYPPESLAKLRQFAPLALQAIERLQQAGVTIGFGTDLMGELESEQCLEFTLRAQVQSNLDVLRSATSGNAKILRMDNEIGTLAAGYRADIIALDANPLADLNVFDSRGSAIALTVQAGAVTKNAL